MAVVEVDERNEISLNPEKGYSYGVIPKLLDISKEDADILWGKDQLKIANSQVRQYHLLDSVSKEKFILEVIFGKNEKLEQFRIISSEVRNPDWQDLKKTQGGVSSSL